MSITWNILGNVTVTGVWQLLPSSSLSEETYRISFTKSGDTWDTKIRTGVYLRFKYQVNNEIFYSKPQYIPVQDFSVVYDLPIPQELKQEGILTRNIEVCFSHPRRSKYSLQSFAVFQILVEECKSDTFGNTNGNGDYSAVANEVNTLKNQFISLDEEVNSLIDLIGE